MAETELALTTAEPDFISAVASKVRAKATLDGATADVNAASSALAAAQAAQAAEASAAANITSPDQVLGALGTASALSGWGQALEVMDATAKATLASATAQDKAGAVEFEADEAAKNPRIKAQFAQFSTVDSSLAKLQGLLKSAEKIKAAVHGAAVKSVTSSGRAKQLAQKLSTLEDQLSRQYKLTSASEALARRIAAAQAELDAATDAHVADDRTLAAAEAALEDAQGVEHASKASVAAARKAMDAAAAALTEAQSKQDDAHAKEEAAAKSLASWQDSHIKAVAALTAIQKQKAINDAVGYGGDATHTARIAQDAAGQAVLDASSAHFALDNAVSAASRANASFTAASLRLAGAQRRQGLVCDILGSLPALSTSSGGCDSARADAQTAAADLNDATAALTTANEALANATAVAEGLDVRAVQLKVEARRLKDEASAEAAQMKQDMATQLAQLETAVAEGTSKIAALAGTLRDLQTQDRAATLGVQLASQGAQDARGVLDRASAQLQAAAQAVADASAAAAAAQPREAESAGRLKAAHDALQALNATPLNLEDDRQLLQSLWNGYPGTLRDAQNALADAVAASAAAAATVGPAAAVQQQTESLAATALAQVDVSQS